VIVRACGLASLGAKTFTALALCADPYPIHISPDHRHAVDQTGSPFLIHGDMRWSLISGVTEEEAERYLENRRRKGFNASVVNLIEHKRRGPVNRYGEGPFRAFPPVNFQNEAKD
jgi:hypothetical protein